MPPTEYHGAKVTIGYDADVCTHSGNCVNNVPGIFNVDNDPWINPDGDTIEQAKQAIRNCPSGALTIKVS